MAKYGGKYHFINKIKFSCKGLYAAWKTQIAFRHEIILLLIGAAIVFNTQTTPLERGLLIGSIILVMIVELLNSAIESIVDRISKEFHPLSAQAKDIGSAAVFLSLVLTSIIWMCILWN